MKRARLLLPVLTALLAGVAFLRPPIPAAEKKPAGSATKSSSKGKTKAATPAPAPKEPAEPAMPKDVTDQKAGRTKDGDSARDSKTMEAAPEGEFDREPPGAPRQPERAAGATPGPTDSGGWEILHHDDRDYVTANSIRLFYRFAEQKVEGNTIWFISPVLIMKAAVGSQDLLINNIKFVMSYPVVETDGKILFSRLDLCKLIDPVLRPSYIGTSNTFETVIVDAGHGGHDSGARGIYGYEKDFALKLAYELKTEIEKRGLKAVMTRRDDKFISLGDRVAFANKIPNSIFVSLHFNSGGSAATGIETYALSPQGSSSIYGARRTDYTAFNGNQRDSENIALATAVHAAVVHRFKMVDRGVKRARWYVLTGLERPGILFEGGFVTNGQDARFIAADNYRKELAGTIGDAILNYRRALKPPPR